MSQPQIAKYYSQRVQASIDANELDTTILLCTGVDTEGREWSWVEHITTLYINHPSGMVSVWPSKPECSDFKPL